MTRMSISPFRAGALMLATACAAALASGTAAAGSIVSRQLRGITIMGGAIAAAGNAPGRAAEWNFFVDPSAATAVLGSGATVTLVPLDATNEAPLDRSFYDGVRSARRTPAMRFVLTELTRQRGAIDEGEAFFWDPLAAAALTDGIVRVERRALHVVESARLPGWTWSGGGGASVQVAARPERRRFERIFLGVLAGRQASGSSARKAP